MQFIDAKFKDSTPEATVEKIQGILAEMGIEVEEHWHDSGVEHCYSLSVATKYGMPSTNGKGVSKAFARASAYGEFIERVQGGLCFYKLQSLVQKPELNLHAYAPDAKYMTVAELVENGEWMDHLLKAYPHPFVTRESIAEQCRIYAEDDKILTIPFYSLFENKHVYLPVAFVEQMYTTNGCCAGNTREEAWVHALSEIAERYCALQVMTKGKSVPKIPEETLRQYPTVAKILDQIHAEGKCCVDVLDFSLGMGFPVVATRIISKENHSYRVDVAADPVLEIALQRTLTELFQGSNMQTVTQKHSGRVLTNVSEYPEDDNVVNQLETGSGFYAVDFFTEEVSCSDSAAEFPDYSNLSNKELLQRVLQLYKGWGKQIYIRNLSYLGFPSYKVIVPGMSETRANQLSAIIPQYALAQEAAKTMRNVQSATDENLNWMLRYSDTIQGLLGRYRFFNRISGVPLPYSQNSMRSCAARAYAAYRLKQYSEAIRYLREGIRACDVQTAKYFNCINLYLAYTEQGIPEKQVRILMYKFFEEKVADRLYAKLDAGLTPYEDYLVSCDYTSCATCKDRDACGFTYIKELTAKVGAKYQAFVHGQDPEEFAL